MTQFADVLLRGGAICALALVSIRFAWRRPLSIPAAAGAALGLSMISYVLITAPSWPGAPQPVERALHLTPVLNPFLIWWLALSIFDDGFRPRLWHLAPLALTTATAWFEPTQSIRAAAVAALYIHLGWVALSTATGDLVASRIRFRRAFFLVAAATGLIVTYVEVTLNGPPHDGVLALQAAAIALLSSGFLHWSHRLADDIWPNSPQPSPSPPANLDSLLLQRLNAAMEAEIWRTEGLTIGALAQHLKTPEHRLRKLINQRLGHRNFSSFVNRARIGAAADALADPRQGEKQILTIAHEAGFSSLGPFNRAFRAETGVSPSDWRSGVRRN